MAVIPSHFFPVEMDDDLGRSSAESLKGFFGRLKRASDWEHAEDDRVNSTEITTTGQARGQDLLTESDYKRHWDMYLRWCAERGKGDCSDQEAIILAFFEDILLLNDASAS